MRKAIIFSLLAIMTLTMGFANSKPVPKPVLKHFTISKVPIAPVMVTYVGLKAYLTDDALLLLPVPETVVQTNLLGAPGCTGSQMCYGTRVTVSQVNACGQTEIIQQYWVENSIICYPVP